MEEFILEIVSMPVTWIMGILGALGLTVAGLFIPAVREVISWRLFGRKVDTAVENVKENTDCSIRNAMEGVKMSAEDRSRLNAAIDASNAKYTTLEGENKELQMKLSENRSGRYGNMEAKLDDVQHGTENRLDKIQQTVDDVAGLLNVMNLRMEGLESGQAKIMEKLTSIENDAHDIRREVIRLAHDMIIENERTDEIIDSVSDDEIIDSVSDDELCSIRRQLRENGEDPTKVVDVHRDVAPAHFDTESMYWKDEYGYPIDPSAIRECVHEGESVYGNRINANSLWHDEYQRYIWHSSYFMGRPTGPAPLWHLTVEWQVWDYDLDRAKACMKQALLQS